MSVMDQYPFIFSRERKWRLRRHLTFWAVWWLSLSFLYSFIAARTAGDYLSHLPVSMMESLVYLIVHIMLSYLLIYFVVPRFIMRQKYGQAAIMVVCCFLLAAGTSALVKFTVINNISDFYMMEPRKFFWPSWASFHMAMMAGLRGGITVAGFAVAIKLMKTLYEKQERNLQLQKENTESQLQLLKAQVHPHFLFNTLNNIFSLTQDKSPAAAKMVTSLSDMLRFMLYESNKPVVPLSREFHLIREYIALEKVRYGNRLDLHVELPDQDNELYIAPLLLLPLIENSFKHGTSDIIDQPWITLSARIEDNMLFLKLLNGKSAGSIIPGENGGIGLQNVRKRLQLLYPGRHELQMQQEEEVFIINMKVELVRIKQIQPGSIAAENQPHV
ncbi:sensor histidine kinase [Terrimonas ferruginea]|uniref:sensor histidine kinase n=1 Tax=Terrimonas ferruginea TaxID=249 RepID=UPI001B7FA20C|nr:histidine kinase [Terrimonas ferruginea]